MFQAGLRYRLHDKKLPGRPDIVFPSRRLVVFVHGCFWHGCPKCVDGQRRVKSNSTYWTKKIFENRERDQRNVRKLLDAQWKVEEIWECEAANDETVRHLIQRVIEHKPSLRKGLC